MKMMLAENIRRLRKEHALTQEQLSEALGVTAGAVYKWEAKLSVPELELIVEMADFFEISVDALLGYEMKDNRPEATVQRLREYRRRKDWTGLEEAEKALKKFPYSFPIIRASEALYRAFGLETGNKDAFRRSLELLEQAFLLLNQNEDPQISEQTLYGKMADSYFGLDEVEKGIELLKKHNAGGMFNHKIGHILALCDRAEEAEPFLSEALAKLVSDLCDTVIGYMNVFFSRHDYASAEAILLWGIGTMSGLRKENKPNFLDKVCSGLLAALACARFLSGQEDAARDTLREAKRLSAFFDASPSYDESDVRFISRIDGASAHDDIGATAADAVQNVIEEFEQQLGSKDFTEMWNHIRTEGENDHD